MRVRRPGKRGTDERGLNPSPPLEYKFGSPLLAYHIDRSIGSKERLILDLIEHTKEHSVAALAEIHDSLRVLGKLILPPNKLKAKELYDLEWAGGEINRTREFLGCPKIRRFIPWADPKKSGYHYHEHPENIFMSEDGEVGLLRFLNVREILKWLAKSGTDSEVMSVLAALHIAVDQESEAVEAYRDMDRVSPYDHYNLGNIYLAKYAIREAREQYKQAVELQSDFNEARYNLGMTYLNVGEWKDAAGLFEAIQEHPGEDDTGSMTRQLRYPRGFITAEEVQEVCNSVIRRSALNNLGICRYWLSDSFVAGVEEALVLFQKAGEWKPPTRHRKIKEAEHNAQLMLAFKSEPMPVAVEPEREGLDAIIGNSAAVKEVRERIRKVSAFDVNVLITGETGTGKELVAQAIHRRCPRKDKPFIVVNCADIPDEMALSDLFGHVKGAYTGAIRDHDGNSS